MKRGCGSKAGSATAWARTEGVPSRRERPEPNSSQARLHGSVLQEKRRAGGYPSARLPGFGRVGSGKVAVSQSVSQSVRYGWILEMDSESSATVRSNARSGPVKSHQVRWAGRHGSQPGQAGVPVCSRPSACLRRGQTDKQSARRRRGGKISWESSRCVRATPGRPGVQSEVASKEARLRGRGGLDVRGQSALDASPPRPNQGWLASTQGDH